MTLPHGTGGRQLPRAGTDTTAAPSTLRAPAASLTATGTGEGA